MRSSASISPTESARAAGADVLAVRDGAHGVGENIDLTGSYHAAFVNGIGWNLLESCDRADAAPSRTPRQVRAPNTTGITS
jgi:hypothetical protein